MGSFSGLGIGLSIVFGCILMGLVAELYYLLWWKKRKAYDSNREVEEFCFLFCWKRRSSFNSAGSSQELTNSVRNPQEQQDLEMGSSKDLGSKGYGEEGVETELMRVHNLCGPPRFLFTIKEESKEDLESDDGKSRSSRKGSRTKSLSDLVFMDGTPFLTPLSSPTVKAPHSLDSYHSHGLNPLFESLTEAEVNRLRSSPPPKFKFLRDAEDKLIRRLLMEEAERKNGLNNEGPVQGCQNSRKVHEEKEGSFVKFINQAAQVLPLASSPTFKPVLDKKNPVQ
ncbi:hypothetical protein CDL12_02900 [Handroanthus impetiginosus]|uniref:Uncharacterized protein n=1 Tax=Handroanthus impetiginosus TaxID=429701 RepID=A0A2G9I3M5_9LAMI|nr:hypothetical protein CDL12_02900 [Handroanthus impetiginosus]